MGKSEKTAIHPSAEIHRTAWVNPYNVVIGKNVKVGPFTSIGCDGFQVNQDEMKIVPHKGKIVIGDNVEILSHCDVDLGLYESDTTIVEAGCKISHYVHLSHSCHIGRNTIIAGHTNIGNTEVGEGCYIHPGCTIASSIKIGDNVVITIGSVVTKDIADNTRVSGFWAVDHEKWVKFIRSIR